MKLYAGDKLIAESVKEGKTKYLVLDPNAEEYPTDLFGTPRNKRLKVGMSCIIKWMEARACPPDRVGIEDILKELRMDRYDAYTIAKHNSSRSLADNFRLEFDDAESACR